MADYWLYKDCIILASAKVASTSLKTHHEIKTLQAAVHPQFKKTKKLIWVFRNPMEKLLSAWTNTMECSNEDIVYRSNEIIKDWKEHQKYAKDFDYFLSFMQRYGNALSKCDDLHWATQHSYLKHIKVDLDEIYEIIDLKELNNKIPLMPIKNQSGWLFRVSRKKAIAEIEPIVQSFYSDDYKLYKGLLNE